MGKIKKILENELIGGTQSTDVYPVTSVKAVYDESNERLDDIIKRKGVVNISTNYNTAHTAEVLTLAQAIAKVPTSDRVLGFSGTFLSSDGWENYQFTGSSVSEWTDQTKWKPSVKVLQELGDSTQFPVSQNLITTLTNAGYIFGGWLVPSIIVSPKRPSFYFTNTAGVYTNCNNIEVLNGETALVTYINGNWTKKIFFDDSKEKASYGNLMRRYITNDSIVGECVKISGTALEGSINCTNLLFLTNKPYTLFNLYSGQAAPSYVVLDSNLIVLEVVKNVSSAEINYKTLPNGATYILANSSSIYNVVLSNKYASVDSGINVSILLDILNIKSIIPIIKSVERSIYTNNSINTRDPKSEAINPFSGNCWIISRFLNTAGGRVTRVHLDFEVTESFNLDVAVAIATDINNTKFKIVSLTTVTIDSSNVDLSSYNIEIPIGISMLSLVIDSANSSLPFKWGSKNDGSGIETKSILTSEENFVVNKEYSIHRIPYIYANFYFEVDALVGVNTVVNDLSNKVDLLQSEVGGTYEGKNVVIFGDSITWYGGDDLTGDRGWTKWFKQHFNFNSIRSYARSGATLSATKNTVYDIEENTGVTTDNNCLYNQVNRMIDAINKGNQEIPDYIFVALGTNDFQRGYDSTNDEITVADNLGIDYSIDVNINTCTTFIKAMRYFHDQIWNITKDVQIIILTPLQRGSYLQDMAKAAEQIKKIAYYLSWPVIDQFGASMLSSVSESLGHAKDSTSWDYTIDGLHPSSRGAKFIGDWIAQQAKSIMRI